MAPDRFMLAAARSGSGKTTITCALLLALKERKLKLKAFKCGPDYIDPMFHKRVLGIESRNLDLFFTDEENTRRLFLLDNDSDVSVIEGVMGLYDGLGGISEEASSYHLAGTLKSPIILIVDAHGCGRSLVAEILGFMAMDYEKLIKGVILNRTSKAFYEMIKPIIEEETSVKCLGFVPKLKELVLDSRHLGLILPGEIEGLDEKLKEAAREVTANVDIDGILEIAQNESGEIGKESEQKDNGISSRIAGVNDPEEVYITSKTGTKKEKLRVGIAMDEAFCFYYEDNLRLLTEAGCELIPFSPIHDKVLPEDINGLILGGGYPENYAKELSENKPMLAEIKRAIDGNMPAIAECGGFMYLHDTITLSDGTSHKMAGVIRGGCHYTGHLVRFGYIELEDNKMQTRQHDGSFEKNNLKNKKIIKKIKKIKGHEFHYFDSDSNGSDWIAKKPGGKKLWECMSDENGHLWGFPHLYYPSCPGITDAFYDTLMEYKTLQKNN